jgi:ethanolamine ammonia-lyase large subunit
MPFSHTVAGQTYHFADLQTLLARASPYRSGDALAGLAAASGEERMAARMALAEVPLKAFLAEDLIPSTRLATAFRRRCGCFMYSTTRRRGRNR